MTKFNFDPFATDTYPFELLLDAVFAWSRETFGPPGPHSTAGSLDHIRKELVEIEEEQGKDLSEWIDVVILAMDGAQRNGFSSEQIMHALKAKYLKNTQRRWPDWRTAEKGKAIEHIRDGEPKKYVLHAETGKFDGVFGAGDDVVGD